jgi:hypothetical protein
VHAAENQLLASDLATTLARINATPVIRPPPPIQQTITNVRPPEIPLLPAGTQLVNTAAGAAAAATIPSVMLANSDGSDAQNTAAAVAGAAAAATAAVTGTSTPGDPNNCGDPKQIIADVAQQVVDEVGLPGLDARLSESQASKEPWLLWQYRGSEVHKLVADRLRRLYGNRFQYRTIGVDFLDTLTGKLIELTTPGQVGPHKKRGGDYDTCDYATYNWKR